MLLDGVEERTVIHWLWYLPLFKQFKNIFLSLDLTPDQVPCMSSSKYLDAAIRTNFGHRTTHMWVLDINLCHIWHEEIAWENPDGLISHLVYTFFHNGPYYPRPTDQDLWQQFPG